jgi:hypothetical protein
LVNEAITARSTGCRWSDPTGVYSRDESGRCDARNLLGISRLPGNAHYHGPGRQSVDHHAAKPRLDSIRVVLKIENFIDMVDPVFRR